MKPSCPLVCIALACLPVVAHAQSPTDPHAEVPRVLYRSVFADTPTGVETATLDWKAANTQVGQFQRGHIDILKWEAAQRQANMPTPAGGASTDTRKP